MFNAEELRAEQARLHDLATRFGELADLYDETGEVVTNGNGERHDCLDPSCPETPKGVQGMTRHIRSAHPRFSERKLDAWKEAMRAETAI